MMNHFILYEQDQVRSTAFHAKVLGVEPQLNMPGMTEFQLSAKIIPRLMPSPGIERLLGPAV